MRLGVRGGGGQKRDKIRVVVSDSTYLCMRGIMVFAFLVIILFIVFAYCGLLVAIVGCYCWIVGLLLV